MGKSWNVLIKLNIVNISMILLYNNVYDMTIMVNKSLIKWYKSPDWVFMEIEEIKNWWKDIYIYKNRQQIFSSNIDVLYSNL